MARAEPSPGRRAAWHVAHMNQLATAALHDQSRHQRASRYEQQWQGAYSRLQARQPTTRISAGADAFAETVLLAQEAARQGRISGSDSPAGQAATTHRQLMGMKPGGGPRQWVAGVAPTTKGAPTRSLMMRLPTEGGAAELTVPPRPAQLVEKGRGAQWRRPRAAHAAANACGFNPGPNGTPTRRTRRRARQESRRGSARRRARPGRRAGPMLRRRRCSARAGSGSSSRVARAVATCLVSSHPHPIPNKLVVRALYHSGERERERERKDHLSRVYKVRPCVLGLAEIETRDRPTRRAGRGLEPHSILVPVVCLESCVACPVSRG